MGLFKPSSFEGQPYEFTTNQISHALYIGMVLFGIGGCAVYFWIFGTFPYRWQVWVWGTAVYFAYELIDQGWRGWDTVEDTGCVSIGLGGPLYTFRQVSEGSTMITGDLMDAVPFVVALSLFLAIGAARRWYQSMGKI